MSDPRSDEERYSFLTAEFILMGIRFIGMCYFMRQAWLYATVPKEKRDQFIVLTFFFLALSMICLFLYRSIMILYDEMIYHSDKGDWFLAKKPIFQLFVFLLRPTLCYLFQNMALLFNIQRFHTIFFENKERAAKDVSNSLRSIILTEEAKNELEAEDINLLRRMSTGGGLLDARELRERALRIKLILIIVF